MTSSIVVIGSGFAGLWTALSAQRLINLSNKPDTIKVTVISPEPSLVMRPRLYESKPETMSFPLHTLFDKTGIEFVSGRVEEIDTQKQLVIVSTSNGSMEIIDYTRLVLAAGSTVNRPENIMGLDKYAFDIDSLESATRLNQHLKSLSSSPLTKGRDTVVVCGAGFTGIELAAELMSRLGNLEHLRVVLVGDGKELLGTGPHQTVKKALGQLGVQIKLGSRVEKIDEMGVTLTSGECIEASTVVWTAGVKASTLTKDIPSPKDNLGRLHVDQYLQVKQVKHVYATGDSACAFADKDHYALMSCQHALQLGRVAGHNVAADLLGQKMFEYSQEVYVCCLDLGSWGACLTVGWNQDVVLAGQLGKRVKNYINQERIYPPLDAEKALESAQPTGMGYLRFIILAMSIWSQLLRKVGWW